jgi:probable rRNA maturation factor
MHLSLKIYYDSVKSRLRGWHKVRKVIDRVIRENNKTLDDLSFIITDCESVRDINIEFLKHEYYTDVITFDYSNENIIKGEIYISIEDVNSNAKKFNTDRNTELVRVMIHGILHIVGFNDQSDEEKSVMRIEEDKLIRYFESL